VTFLIIAPHKYSYLLTYIHTDTDRLLVVKIFIAKPSGIGEQELREYTKQAHYVSDTA